MLLFVTRLFVESYLCNRNFRKQLSQDSEGYFFRMALKISWDLSLIFL